MCMGGWIGSRICLSSRALWMLANFLHVSCMSLSLGVVPLCNPPVDQMLVFELYVGLVCYLFTDTPPAILAARN